MLNLQVCANRLRCGSKRAWWDPGGLCFLTWVKIYKATEVIRWPVLKPSDVAGSSAGGQLLRISDPQAALPVEADTGLTRAPTAP